MRTLWIPACVITAASCGRSTLGDSAKSLRLTPSQPAGTRADAGAAAQALTRTAPTRARTPNRLSTEPTVSVTDTCAVNAPSPLILASRSPQRRAILAEAGFDFEVVSADVEEADSG